MDINLTRKESKQALLIPGTRGAGGFTLIEVLIVLLMSMILMGAMVSTMVSLRKSYTTQEVAADTQQDVRMAMVFMTRDIKQAGLDPLRTAGAGFERADSSYLRVSSDRIGESVEANGSIDDENFERVSYFRDPSTNELKIRLYEYDGSTSQSTQTLADNITSLRFSYFDADGDATTDRNAIRSVGIDLTATAPAGLEGDVVRSYSTQVRCRNLSLP